MSNPPSYGTNEGDISPPAYEAPSDAPPSYDSLFGKVKSAKQESSGLAEFFKKVAIIILGTIGCTICVGIVLAIPLSMLVIGSVFVHDCPAERFIPIYLIVGGAFGIIKNLGNIVQRMRNHQQDREEENAKTNPFDGILNCFLLGWFIAGNVWVYRTKNNHQETDPDAIDYCHPTLYWFSFWIITATYILIGAMCCCVCLGGCLACLFGDRVPKRDNAEP